jgi:hypothetical protein
MVPSAYDAPSPRPSRASVSTVNTLAPPSSTREIATTPVNPTARAATTLVPAGDAPLSALPPPPPRDTSVHVLENTPVYLEPDRTLTPLKVLRGRASVRFLEATGAWYHVTFQDPQWGTRYGYVEAGRVDANSVAVDLSVRTSRQQPVDLSVKSGRAASQTPVDLAVLPPPARGGASALDPVDLSVRPRNLEPVDLSVPRSHSQEPVDLSVRPTNR